MTRADLDRLEEVLGAPLPTDLRDLYLSYPFGSDSWAAQLAMPDDAERVIRDNSDRAWLVDLGVTCADDCFLIGSDGGETVYFVNLKEPRTRIFAGNLETGSFAREATSLDEWLAQIRSVDDELAQDAAAMSQKRWWQFWKGG